MKILIMMALACWCLTVSGQTPEDARSFVQVERIGDATARHFFVFATDSRNYTIRHDGRGECYATNVMRKNFDLKMGPGGRLERLYFLKQGADLLLLYEITDGRSGWAYITRMDQRTARPKWLAPVNAINVGVGMVERDDAYLISTNLVARIDLLSGKYVWQMTDFAQSVTAEFRLTELTPDRVVLREDMEQGREIEIDKKNGHVIASAQRSRSKN